jgi:hypothetical protein
MGNSQGSYIAARIALEDGRRQKLVLGSIGTLAPPGSASAERLAREHAERLRSYQPSPENMRDLTMHALQQGTGDPGAGPGALPDERGQEPRRGRRTLSDLVCDFLSG